MLGTECKGKRVKVDTRSMRNVENKERKGMYR